MNCCGLYISGKETAPTPETLMRSRYTAYTQADIKYIEQTMKEPAAKNFDPIEAEAWAKNVNWKGLQVLNFKSENDRGWVEFIASYTQNDTDIEMHELSEFHFENGRWYYVDGQTKLPKSHHRARSIGRNDTCPCGSQKKFKKCCGK